MLEELNKRHAICNIHPHRSKPINENIFTTGPVPLFEFIANTTRAVLNLIGNDVILRYPNITWIIPHCGPFLPNIYEIKKGPGGLPHVGKIKKRNLL